MAVGFINITLTPAADVATDATMVFTYPSGNASQFRQSGEKLVVSGLQNILAQAADTFTLSYGGSSVTVTYKDATSIPAGTKVTLQLPLGAYAPLVDNSTGTASNTIAAITDAATKNAIASLAAKVNTLLSLSREIDNVPDV